MLAARCFPAEPLHITSNAHCCSPPLGVQDDRPVFQAFKSLLIGPHLYAGLTHGPRTIVADPKQIASMVMPLTSEGTLPQLLTESGMTHLLDSRHFQHSGCKVICICQRPCARVDAQR